MYECVSMSRLWLYIQHIHEGEGRALSNEESWGLAGEYRGSAGVGNSFCSCDGKDRIRQESSTDVKCWRILMWSKIFCWSYRSLKHFISYKGEKGRTIIQWRSWATRYQALIINMASEQRRTPTSDEAAGPGHALLCSALAGSTYFIRQQGTF